MTSTFKDSRPLMGSDPFLFRIGNDPYLIESEDDRRITISLLSGLQNPYRVSRTIIWESNDEQELWAPELHQLGDFYHILYSFSNGENHTHRTHILVSTNPFGPYQRYRIGPDIWGIDQTLFSYQGTEYLVHSGWEDNETDFFPNQQNLYIAPFLDPEQRVCISRPTLTWEGSINEGPQYIQSCIGQGLLFSANSSWTQDYCTGFLELFGTDPLNPEHWAKDVKPLGTNAGHAQFFEYRMVYHKKLSTLPGWADRAIIIGAPLDEYVYETGELFP